MSGIRCIACDFVIYCCNILLNEIYSYFLKIGGRNSTLIMNTIDITSKKFGFYNITVAAYDLFNGYKYLDSVEVPLFVKVMYIDIRYKKKLPIILVLLLVLLVLTSYSLFYECTVNLTNKMTDLQGLLFSFGFKIEFILQRISISTLFNLYDNNSYVILYLLFSFLIYSKYCIIFLKLIW